MRWWAYPDALPERGLDGSLLWQVGSVVCTAYAAAGIGLAISALARDAMQAMMIVPLVLIPQILFSGLVVETKQMPRSALVFTSLMPSYAAQTMMDVGAFWHRPVTGNLYNARDKAREHLMHLLRLKLQGTLPPERAGEARELAKGVRDERSLQLGRRGHVGGAQTHRLDARRLRCGLARAACARTRMTLLPRILQCPPLLPGCCRSRMRANSSCSAASRCLRARKLVVQDDRIPLVMVLQLPGLRIVKFSALVGSQDRQFHFELIVRDRVERTLQRVDLANQFERLHVEQFQPSDLQEGRVFVRAVAGIAVLNPQGRHLARSQAAVEFGEIHLAFANRSCFRSSALALISRSSASRICDPALVVAPVRLVAVERERGVHAEEDDA